MNSILSKEWFPGLIGFVLLGIVISDLFVIPRKSMSDTVARGYISNQKAIRGRSYELYYIIGKSDSKYLVSSNVFYTIAEKSQFTIYKTFFFTKNASISWCDSNKLCFQENMNSLNSSALMEVTVIVMATLNLMIFLKVLKMQSKTRRSNSYVLLIGSVLLFIHYLVN